MEIPTLEFLSMIERRFAVSYPKPFKDFCENARTFDPLADFPNLSRGRFVCDLETMLAVNQCIGTGQWSDFERAGAVKVRPKDGRKLWGGILPIFFEGTDIYGYYYPKPDDHRIYVWSVHCIVHTYPDLAGWLTEYS